MTEQDIHEWDNIWTLEVFNVVYALIYDRGTYLSRSTTVVIQNSMHFPLNMFEQVWPA